MKKGSAMEYNFHYLLMANQSIVHKTVFSMLKDSGLTLGQPKVLDYLKDHDGAGQKEIAAGCHVDPASITAILNGMEDKQLIQRRHLNGNRRSSYVFLTEKGQQMQKKVEQSFRQIEEIAFTDIPEAARQEFLRTFEHIYQNLLREREASQHE